MVHASRDLRLTSRIVGIAAVSHSITTTTAKEKE
jgi:hypothetical protein